MKHSMLITGKNHVYVEELFAHFMADFECLSCSAGYEDIKNHLNHFVPDVMMYCLHEEDPGAMALLELQGTLKEKGITMVLTGTKKDCDFFVSCAPKLAKFVFEKPINPDMITDCLTKFLDEKDTDDLLSEIDAFGARKRIMVIDDDPFMLKLMTEYLKNEYDVETATSGKAAIKQLTHKRADLILLDYEMPEETGPQVLEHLHQNEVTKNIPVFFLTSITHRELIEKALLYKPQGYLLKPVNREKLLEAIKNLLG